MFVAYSQLSPQHVYTDGEFDSPLARQGLLSSFIINKFNLIYQLVNTCVIFYPTIEKRGKIIFYSIYIEKKKSSSFESTSVESIMCNYLQIFILSIVDNYRFTTRTVEDSRIFSCSNFEMEKSEERISSVGDISSSLHFVHFDIWPLGNMAIRPVFVEMILCGQGCPVRISVR